jgi:oligopeptide/dipeptide ABC transporter ATP-binding protein
MYLGEIVESTSADSLFSRPLHPYSRALLSAVLAMRPQEQREQIILTGDPPSPINPPSGCRFHPRCPFAFERCAKEVPRLKEVEPGHNVACHLY